MARVAQIIPYFGHWPLWMPLYLHSCGRNKMVDFIFFTDCEVPSIIYPNTHFTQISFGDYCHLVSSRLGIDYTIKNPYKLTDLKPFLGLIHQQELHKYDWWGFGDIDLVYGDMSMLLNERNLQKYDVITTHNYHIAGHCAFVKNNKYFRELCLSIHDWQTRIVDDMHYGFDEAEWSNLVYPHIAYPLSIYRRYLSKIHKRCFNWFMNNSNKLINPKQHFIEYHTSPIPKDGQKWTYDVKKSKIISPTGKELPYLHFLFFKKTPWFESETFWQSGFYKISRPIETLNHINIDIHSICQS